MKRANLILFQISGHALPRHTTAGLALRLGLKLAEEKNPDANRNDRDRGGHPVDRCDRRAAGVLVDGRERHPEVDAEERSNARDRLGFAWSSEVKVISVYKNFEKNTNKNFVCQKYLLRGKTFCDKSSYLRHCPQPQPQPSDPGSWICIP